LVVQSTSAYMVLDSGSTCQLGSNQSGMSEIWWREQQHGTARQLVNTGLAVAAVAGCCQNLRLIRDAWMLYTWKQVENSPESPFNPLQNVTTCSFVHTMRIELIKSLNAISSGVRGMKTFDPFYTRSCLGGDKLTCRKPINWNQKHRQWLKYFIHRSSVTSISHEDLMTSISDQEKPYL
jgi:hypothetical protein